jgi:Right handed beta helix region
VLFRPNGVYRMNSGLQVNARQNLRFEGQGATLRSHGNDAWQSSNFIVTGSSGIKINNFRLIGNDPTPGIFELGLEFAHGVYAYGSRDLEISNVTIDKVWGDALAVDEWADGIWFHDSTVTSAARNGVAIMAGRNITVERVHFERTGGSMLDIEPYLASGGAIDVIFRRNTWNTHGPVEPIWGLGFFVGAEGAPGSTVQNVTVEDNVVYGAALHTLITISRRQNVVIRRNESRISVPAGLYGNPVMYFANVDGLTVTDNRQPMSGGKFVGYANSTSVTVAGNRTN